MVRVLKADGLAVSTAVLQGPNAIQELLECSVRHLLVGYALCTPYVINVGPQTDHALILAPIYDLIEP